jgi:hypothetical protein
MANEFKQLLLKIGMSTSDYQTFIRQVNKDLQDVQTTSRQTAKEALDASKLQIAATKEQIAAEQLLQAQAKTMASLDQAKVAWNKQLAAVQATKLADARTETAEMQKQITLLRLQAAQAAQARAAAAAAQGSGSGGGGMLGGLLQSFSNAAGGGMLGSVFAGVLGGGGALEILNKVVEGVGELVKKLAEIPFEAEEIAQKFTNMSATTGASIEELEKLRIAGAAVGMDLDQMSTLLTRMAFQFTKGSDETSRAEKVLNRFGVQVTDTHTKAIRPLTDILLDLSGVFEKLPDGWTKNRIMIEAFGRQGAQLIPVLNQGKDKMKEMFQQGSELSILFDKDLVESTHKWNIETEKWNMEWEQFKVTMGQGVLPLLISVADYINRIVQAMNVDADVPKQFSDDIGNWATSQDARKKGAAGSKGKYSRMQMSSAGTAHMKEKLSSSAANELDLFNPNQTWEELYANTRDSGGNVNKVIEAFAKEFPDAIEKSTASAGKLDPRLQDLEAKMKKLDAATQKFNETVAKGKEEQAQGSIAEQKTMVGDDYKQGNIAYVDYAQTMSALDKAMYDSRVEYANKWAIAEKARLHDSEKDAAVRAEKIKTVDEELKQKLEKAEEQYSQDKHKIKLQGLQDELAAQLENIKSAEAYAKASLENVTKLTEDAFKDRQITAEQYIQLRQSQFTAEYDDEVEGIKAKYALEADNEKRSASIAADVAKAKMGYDAKVSEFAAQQAEIRDKYAKQGFDNARQELQGLLGATQAQGAGSNIFGSTAISELSQLRDISVEYLHNRLAALQLETAGTQTWHQTRLEVVDAVKDVQQYNQQLLIAKDVLVPIAATFASISKDLGQFGGATAKELSGAFKAGAESLQQFSHLKDVFSKSSKQDPIQQLKTNLQDVFAKVKATSDTTGQKFSELATRTDTTAMRLSTFADSLLQGKDKVVDAVDQLVTAFDKLSGRISGKTQGGIDDGFSSADLASLSGSGGPDANSVEGQGNPSLEASQQQAAATQDSTSKLQDFTEKLQAGIGAVTGLIAAFSNAQGAVGGSIAGGSSAFGALSSLTSNPYALGAGVVGGAILGGILGQKRSAAKKMADDFKKQTQDIMSNVQDGTTKLKDGIADLAKERQDAIASLSHDKKGKKELQGVLDQIDAATKQLKNEQKKLMEDLTKQLQILSAPTEYQQWLGNIQSILDKYQQFADAAETTQQLAQAQQFLNLSLKQYSDTLAQDVQTAQQDAINNAIQLMDLQKQAATLMTQEAQQEYNILTQGNVTRQMTNAQSKGQQIEAARAQRDDQLDQINQQVALAQFKYDHEKQIFNLATTRIGLESQLLTLQKEQTMRDIDRITALNNLVGALASGNITTLAQLLQLLGLSSGTTTSSDGNNPDDGGNVRDIIDRLRHRRTVNDTLEGMLTQAASSRGSVGSGAGVIFRLL